MSIYRYIVCAPNVVGGYNWSRTGNQICELYPKSASINFGLNRVGTVDLTVHESDLSDKWSRMPLGWSKNLTPGGASLWVMRNSKVIWGGLIWDIKPTSESQLCTISAEEFFGYYDRITLSTHFSGNNSSAAVGDLINTLMQVEGASSMYMMMWDFSHSGYRSGTHSLTGAYTPQWYEYEKHKVGDLIRGLLSTTGCDWHQAVTNWNVNNNAPAPIRFQLGDLGYVDGPGFGTGAYLGVYGHGLVRPYNGIAGRDWEIPATTGSVETGTLSGAGSTPAPAPLYPWSQLAFEWGRGTRETIDSWDITYSARRTGNRVRVGGFGQGGRQLYQRYWLNSTNNLRLPFLDFNYEDPNLRSQADVNKKAQAIVTSTGLPQMYLTAKVRQPNPLCSYDVVSLGDRVRCTIHDDAFRWTGKLRVQGLSLQVDSSENEWMIADLSPDTSAYT